MSESKCPFHNVDVDSLREDGTGENIPDDVIMVYEISNEPNLMDMVESSKKVKREWMDATPNKFANRCLPLLMANSIGWQLTIPQGFSAHWNGGPEKSDIDIRWHDGSSNQKMWVGQSHFGNGVLTFMTSFLFKTPKGVNIFVTGPMNQPKNAITPLQGIIETDWLPFTFTMNWQFTQPDTWVHFKKDEAVAQLFPIERNYAEKFTPVIDRIENHQSVQDQYNEWLNSRVDFNTRLKNPNDNEVTGKDWEKNYFQGKHKDGTSFTDHQVRCKMKSPIRKG